MSEIQKALKVFFLMLVLLFIFPLRITPTLVRQTPAIETMSVKGSNPVLPVPEERHRIVPVSLLVYTEYADMTPGQEYEHTIAAINETYGNDYYATQLTDYTTLSATMLEDYDILLIPEQEGPSLSEMQDVGTAWASILPTWIEEGGIVILMTHWFSGIQIYNESGLMQFSDVTADATWSTVNLVNTSDALARGVASSWTAESGSVSRDTPETTVVVDDGTYPLVIHKIMGRGHIVWLGYDLFNREPNQDRILSNAIKLHRHVVFDNSHGQYQNLWNGYSQYAADLAYEGFAVSNMGHFSPTFINACDVLVITHCTLDYTLDELDTLQAFVSEGGGLFIAGDWDGYGDEIRPIFQIFGYRADISRIIDTDDYAGISEFVVYTGENLVNHSLMLGVSAVEQYRGTAFTELPTETKRIIVTDTDGTSDWFNGSSADGFTCWAAQTYASGRIVVAADSTWLIDNDDYDTDGSVNYLDSDNERLAMNTIRWLSAAGLKEQIVLFEESNDPWIYTANNMFLPLSQQLTSNGYTIHWMSTFHTSFLDQAHVLVILDPTYAYLAAEIIAIKDFVAAGGGLLLIGDGIGGNWRDMIDPLSNEFGIDWHDTEYLEDSDDFIGLTNYVIYDGANIGTHPITQGVARIEVEQSTGLIDIGSGTALVKTDTDGTTTWSGGSPANDVAVFAATEYQSGRVVCISDAQFLVAAFDHDGDGMPLLFEHDNILFTVNTFQWLTENRGPVVTVTSPNGGETLEGTSNSLTWTATDPNKDLLTFDIEYSADNGATWSVLASGHTTTTRNWDVTSVAEGDQYLIRVTAFDQEYSSQDESDAVFIVESEGPIITNVYWILPLTYFPPVEVGIVAEVTDVSGVASVVCYYSTDGGSTWANTPMPHTTGDSYSVNIGPFSGVIVQFYVEATDNSAAGHTSTSATDSFTISAASWPGFPIETIILGLALCLGLVIVLRRKRREVKP